MRPDTCHAPGADLALPCLASLLELQDVATLGSETSGLAKLSEKVWLTHNEWLTVIQVRIMMTKCELQLTSMMHNFENYVNGPSHQVARLGRCCKRHWPWASHLPRIGIRENDFGSVHMRWG